MLNTWLISYQMNIKKDMEQYSLEEFTTKAKKALQVLLYVLEVKTGIKSKATNIHPHTHNVGATLYFELEMDFETEDPDVGSFGHTLNKFDDKITNFFNKVVLTPKVDFITVSLPPEESDDMVGLFMGINFNWDNHDSGNNTIVKYAFEYNLYYDEYDQYYD